MTDDELIERFEQGSLPAQGFHHVDHVRVAFTYLCRYPALEAVQKFSIGLKRFATAQGKEQLYHETLTWAYMFLIRERMARNGNSQHWEEFARKNEDLLAWKDGVLKRYYREDTLTSEIAKATFVLPDRCS
jgi:hypothetical protein